MKNNYPKTEHRKKGKWLEMTVQDHEKILAVLLGKKRLRMVEKYSRKDYANRIPEAHHSQKLFWLYVETLPVKNHLYNDTKKPLLTFQFASSPTLKITSA